MEDHAKELGLNQFTYNGKPLKDFKQKRNMIRFLAIHYKRTVKRSLLDSM